MEKAAWFTTQNRPNMTPKQNWKYLPQQWKSSSGHYPQTPKTSQWGKQLESQYKITPSSKTKKQSSFRLRKHGTKSENFRATKPRDPTELQTGVLKRYGRKIIIQLTNIFNGWIRAQYFPPNQENISYDYDTETRKGSIEPNKPQANIVAEHHVKSTWISPARPTQTINNTDSEPITAPLPN